MIGFCTTIIAIQLNKKKMYFLGNTFLPYFSSLCSYCSLLYNFFIFIWYYIFLSTFYFFIPFKVFILFAYPNTYKYILNVNTNVNMYLESAPLHCSSSSIAFGSTTVHLSSVIDVAKAHFHGFTGGRQFNWFVCASR